MPSIGLPSPLRLYRGQELQRPHIAALLMLLFSLAYVLAAKLGTSTSLPPEGIAILWPPNAIVLLALLYIDRTRWWLVFLATLAAEIAADVPAYKEDRA